MTKALVTGVTGYIGGRLAPRLLERGYEVRVMVRDRRRITGRPWADRVEMVEADLLDPASLESVMSGIDLAYYLVHSMGGGTDFARRDREAATHFANAVLSQQPQAHVIYLGGLQPKGQVPGKVSEHLDSRAQTGRVLREQLPGRVTEFRAGPIIGAGSASFEMVRYLTERLPIMVTPKWVRNEVAPISVRDILEYLQHAGEQGPAPDDGIVEVGASPLSFRHMMQQYAEVRGLSRWIFPLPVLAPKLAARWVGFITPINNRVAVPLVAGVTRPLLADTARAQYLFPSIDPADYRTSVERALTRIETGHVETRWTGALGRKFNHKPTSEASSQSPSNAAENAKHPADHNPPTPAQDSTSTVDGLALEDWAGLIRETRQLTVHAPAQTVYRSFATLGGETGWLTWDWAWRLRGSIDSLIGGPGLRRGRRDRDELLVGEALDWWRVESIDPGRSLVLHAEMKVPGQAWLIWRAQPIDEQTTRFEQTALFEPHGLPGVLYWYGLYPAHWLIFTDLARALRRRAERGDVPDADKPNPPTAAGQV